MRRRTLALGAIALMVLSVSSGLAANRASAPFGAMAGLVTDSHGTPQMGAAVALLAADGRTLRQVYTNDKGAFLVERVLPGLYALRVTLVSYLPVLKENILIAPGVNSFLSINLASLFNTMDMLRGKSAAPDKDDDWTWVLRSSAATRPVLRLLPQTGGAAVASRAGLTSTMPTILEFSGGAGRSTGSGSEADFNTSFAVADQLFTNTSVLLGGNVGYERNTPATAFRGVVRREMANGSTPEVAVTLRQIFLPGAFWDHPGRSDSMQNLTVSASNRLKVADGVRLEYGFLYDSISFLRRLNSFSPYGRLILEPGPTSSVRLAYTEGVPNPATAAGEPLRQVASELAVFPRISMRGNTPTVQRGRHIEGSYKRQVAAGTAVEAGAYDDQLNDMALNAAIAGEPFSDEFFPDVFTENYSFNGGTHSTAGVRAAVQQKFGEHFQTTFAYAYAGMLLPERTALYTNNPEELRSILKTQQRHALTAKFNADVPVTKTRVLASYKWVPGGAISSGDLYDESIGQAQPNFNIVVRQPLPSMFVLPGRIEAVADFRNLLAQGYVPIVTADGKRLLLVQNVRSFRGGFSFHF